MSNQGYTEDREPCGDDSPHNPDVDPNLEAGDILKQKKTSPQLEKSFTNGSTTPRNDSPSAEHPSISGESVSPFDFDEKSMLAAQNSPYSQSPPSQEFSQLPPETAASSEFSTETHQGSSEHPANDADSSPAAAAGSVEEVEYQPQDTEVFVHKEANVDPGSSIHLSDQESPAIAPASDSTDLSQISIGQITTNGIGEVGAQASNKDSLTDASAEKPIPEESLGHSSPLSMTIGSNVKGSDQQSSLGESSEQITGGDLPKEDDVQKSAEGTSSVGDSLAQPDGLESDSLSLNTTTSEQLEEGTSFLSADSMKAANDQSGDTTTPGLSDWGSPAFQPDHSVDTDNSITLEHIDHVINKTENLSPPVEPEVTPTQDVSAPLPRMDTGSMQLESEFAPIASPLEEVVSELPAQSLKTERESLMVTEADHSGEMSLQQEEEGSSDVTQAADLSKIAESAAGPDVELETVLLSGSNNVIEHATAAAVTENQQQGLTHPPINLSRFSPAQIVAITGGAPVEIIRTIEHGLDGDIGDVPTTSVQPEGSSVWKRVSTPYGSGGHEAGSTIDIHLKLGTHLTPTSPDVVRDQSEVVFGNFIAERYRLELSASVRIRGSDQNALASASASAQAVVEGASAAPNASGASMEDLFGSEFSSIRNRDPNSMEMIVARHLAQIGDEIVREHGERLDRMIKLLPSDQCPLDTFYNVARALFIRGPTNWGQIVTLFYFGYRLVLRFFRSGVVNAFLKVFQCLASFCDRINIFKWIAQQGGWLIIKYLRCGETADESAEQSAEPSATSEVPVLSSSENQPESQPLRVLLSSPWFYAGTGLTVAVLALLLYRRLGRQ
ncbi:unnamed protein product [Calicophoron daubneyi]|uniref:Bcl-2 Bcl-2 homology region 1-3 domain-containing protein n=1 Tax=Calicophoron daubneyi TaxID=300641 RepID=A0AAV2T0Z5_CALDB